MIGFKVNWDDHLRLIEFAYNNNYYLASRWLHMRPFIVEDPNIILGGSEFGKQG